MLSLILKFFYKYFPKKEPTPVTKRKYVRKPKPETPPSTPDQPS